MIAERLDETGLTVAEFARQLGVAPSYIYSILKEQSRLTLPATVERAATILGVPADVLYVAAKHLPPDCWEIVRRRPEMVRAIRALDARLDREAQHGSNR